MNFVHQWLRVYRVVEESKKLWGSKTEYKHLYSIIRYEITLRVGTEKITRHFVLLSRTPHPVLFKISRNIAICMKQKQCIEISSSSGKCSRHSDPPHTVIFATDSTSVWTKVTRHELFPLI